MKIQNEIEIAAPPDELFEILSSPERVAPCMPGASLEGKEGDDAYEGTVKLKVGPITAAYQGTLRFVELDRENRRAVMRASGQETNGQGNAEATITATVSGSDSQSVLSMETDMEVRGKAAQFGRGALGNVSQKILDQFARNLESQVLSAGEREARPTIGRRDTGAGTGRSRRCRSRAGSPYRELLFVPKDGAGLSGGHEADELRAGLRASQQVVAKARAVGLQVLRGFREQRTRGEQRNG